MKKTTKDFQIYLDSLDKQHKKVIEQIDFSIVEKFPSSQRFLWEGIFWGGN
ncbi:hypothetical protein [Bacillus ndiopicus]|uniref:hypothetical protein n=1 Tax=Bacillus ndiopicus TaxID=1347368 RepID=UPI000B33272C|nr:hypothetical protein [Bacillus ndiopicus]